MAPPEDEDSRRVPRYEGEDLSPTTSRELMGWYTYGLSAEIFAICAVGSFLPVTLEQLARERGVLWSDKNTPCLAADDSSPSHALFARDRDAGQCVVHIFGVEVTTASFALYTFSMAVFVQAVTLASFSAVADYGTYRKRLLLTFGYVGSAATMMFLIVLPSIFLIGPILVIIGVTCLGSSFVLLNSFLPLLAANHPDLAELSSNRISQHSEDTVGTSPKARVNSPEIQMSTKISARGVGIGYAAAVTIQILSIGILVLMKKVTSSPSLPLRLVVFMAGAWWFVGTVPTQLWLRDRAGPPLKAVSDSQNRIRVFLGYVGFAWSSLWKTIKQAARLRQVTVFLIAWFLLSDAMATVSGTAILFARTELHMGTIAIALLSITATTSGIAGAVCWPIISRRFKLQTNHTIIGCITLLEIIPLYGLLGYIPFIQKIGFGGLQQPWEIYPLGFVHGFVMGGLSSYCRAFFGLLIPPGSEAAFYALMAITDKGSSAVGPAVVGKIVDVTGHIRPAFIFLAVLVLIPGPMIWYVDVKKGKEDAVRMAEGMKGIRGEEVEMSRRGTDRDEEVEGLLNDEE